MDLRKSVIFVAAVFALSFVVWSLNAPNTSEETTQSPQEAAQPSSQPASGQRAARTTTQTNTSIGSDTLIASQVPPPQPVGGVYDNATVDDIFVTEPQLGAEVSGSFIVSGQARGSWFFEASFPLELRGSNNQLLLQTPVQAQGRWMTPEFVLFYERLTLPLGYTGPATLVLRNDNPSGLEENERSLTIPIVVK